MKRITRVLTAGCAVVALAACSHKNDNDLLTYVPADTPYLVANLKPLNDEARTALTQPSMTSAMRINQVSRMRAAADELSADNKNDLANLLRAFADSLDGKTYVQAASDIGINTDGMFAVYGLGLSPVMRGQLSDPDKFHAYIARLEKAYGHKIATKTMGKIKYRYVALGKSNLQVVVSSHDKQFVIAVLPVQVDKKTLRLALGVDHAEHSVRDTKRLAELADTDGYGPYSLGYIDTTKLPALIAGSTDPMLKALLAAGPAKTANKWDDKLPASCESDLSRIASRVPLISFGYTKLEAKHHTQQVDIRLAPDIVKAFRGIGSNVPGLGGDEAVKALVDVAIALPITKIRDFWLTQAEAIKNQPFTCPALASLNDLAKKAGQYLPKLSMPPLGQLRGLRVVVNQMDLGSKQGRATSFRGRVLLASKNPDGMLSLAKAMVPALGTLTVPDDGKPTALPTQSMQKYKLDQPAWIAMDKNALAIGIGKNEKTQLTGMLNAATGKNNRLSRTYVTGDFYRQWLSTMRKSLENTANTIQAQPASAESAAKAAEMAKAQKALADAQQQMAAVQAMFKHVDHVASHARMTDQGIRITAESSMK